MTKAKIATATFAVILSALFFSCESTRVYVETTDLLYEDDVLISESRSLTRDGVAKENGFTSYYDLSSAGFLVTNRASTSATAHSFVASKTQSSKSSAVEVSYTLVETRVDLAKNIYYTDVIGAKSASYTPSTSDTTTSVPVLNFSGDDFLEKDEDFFLEVKGLTLKNIIEGSADIDESSGKSYRTEEKIDEVTVRSVPNGQYIFYQILGKPFVILGSGTWNILKCVGYSFMNFTCGYNLTSGKTEENLPLWMMPSFSTAKKKFSEAKAANAIEHYPQYHLPFTNNTIEVTKIEQETGSAHITPENAHVTRTASERFDNTLSVTRSASADAKYTAGVAGLIGTATTIPVSVLTWVGGAAFGIYAQTQGY